VGTGDSEVKIFTIHRKDGYPSFQCAWYELGSPRTIDGWVSRRMIPFIEPNPRLHLFDPVAVKSALLAQFSIPANIPEAVLRRAELQTTS
jgi:hypothetical protein